MISTQTRQTDPSNFIKQSTQNSGLVSVKACLEANLKVTCFDRSSKYGGLWNYRPNESPADDQSGQFEPSVMRTTILNTSKELSAFSDFPPPAKLPNFMRHNLYMDYINSYVDHFKLQPHLRLEHEIVQCKPEWRTSDKTTTGANGAQRQQTNQIRWAVTVRDLQDNREFTHVFDHLMIAVGHHNVAYIPSFTGQHKFKGEIIHSGRVKDILGDERFHNKRVLVVGFGNSACDAANDLALVAQKCYVSCHRGNWFVNRLSGEGLYDFKLKTRYYSKLSKVLPTSVSDSFLIDKLESRTNHRMLGLEPRHKPSEQVPVINDLFPYRLLTGGITLKGSISTFTENGVIFEGENEHEEHQVDVVILATGYVSRIPFLNEFELGLKSADSNEYELYLNMFAPRLTLHDHQSNSINCPLEAIKSLAFIGLVQPSGSITVVSELQARYAVQVFKGQLELPERRQMLKHIQKVRRHQSRAIRSHSRDQLVGDWIGYLDLIAEKLDCRPNLTQMFFKDFSLWKQLMFGPSVSYQYRLAGPNKWPKARETILTVADRVYMGINEGKNHILFQSRRKCLSDGSAKQPQK